MPGRLAAVIALTLLAGLGRDAVAQRKPPPLKQSVKAIAAPGLVKPPPVDTGMLYSLPLCGLTVRLRPRPMMTVAVIPSYPVPDFTGKTLADVDDWRNPFVIQLKAGRVRGKYPVNTIAGQAPPASTRLMRGDTIAVCWRLPEFWPPVTGMAFEPATNVLADSGYQFAKRDTVVNALKDVGLVVVQRPLAGTPADSGDTDTLLVGVARPIVQPSSPPPQKKPVGGGDRPPPPPSRSVPWLPVAALILAVAGYAGPGRSWLHLRAISVAPESDSGSQEMRIGPAPDEALAEMGLSFNVSTDAGTQSARFPEPPPRRDERTDA